MAYMFETSYTQTNARNWHKLTHAPSARHAFVLAHTRTDTNAHTYAHTHACARAHTSRPGMVAT